MGVSRQLGILVVCVMACGRRGDRAADSAPVVLSRHTVVKPAAAEPQKASLQPAPAPLAAKQDAASHDLLDTLPGPSHSTSIGSPTNGRVEGSVALPVSGPGFRFNDRRDAAARYATAEVVRAIVRAARAVEDALPGGQLVVHDLGFEAGGRIPHHGSHRAGRDADVLFYLLGDDGKPTPSVGAPLDPDGVGFDYKDLSRPDDDVRVRFDAPRTFHFVRALLEDPEATVQRIFVVEHLRSKLMEEGKRVRAPPALMARLSDVTCQPGYPHDDHLHVRWFCSVEDLARGCQDLPPLYDWRAEALRSRGIEPVIAQRRRSRDPAPVVTEAEAKRRVKQQQPHPSVLAFLRRREGWQKQPHPGRRYCR